TAALGFDPTPEHEDRIWDEATQPGGPPIGFSNLAHIRNSRVQELRETVLAGRIDRIQSGTTAMEKLFNLQAVESAREYVYHHPEDELFVPADLPEPDLINIKPVGDSSPWTSTVSR